MKLNSNPQKMFVFFAALWLLLSMFVCQKPGAVFASSRAGLANIRATLNAYTQQKVTAPDGATKDGFGYSVAISDDGGTALVGTYYIEYGIPYPIGPGSVYVFVRDDNTWVLQQKLPTPDLPDADLFGYSVALSADGNTALVGAQGGTGPVATQVPGAAYVFTRSNDVWNQQSMLTALDRVVGDHFGISVALSDDGDTALIGAYVDDVGANENQGSAHVFVRSGSTWDRQALLTAADGAAGDYFGRSVGLSSDGNTAIVGANMKTLGSNSNQGAAYIFTRAGTTWNQQAGLTAAEGGAYDWFGVAVSISADGNTGLVGAEGHTVGGNFLQGAAFVFVRAGTTWSEQAMLAMPEDEAAFWGNTLALSPDGSTALIEEGYLFHRSGSNWTPGTRVLPADGEASFGSSVALSADGATALVGASSATIGGNQSQGAAYFFMRSEGAPVSIYLPLIRR